MDLSARYLVAVLMSIFLLACDSQSQIEDHPNVIIIMSDDQGWGDLSLNGNSNLETPNIDRIGLEGAIFESFFAEPVCSPTRAELLTGRFAARGGVYSTSTGGERLDLDEKTIAEYFRQAGYHTAAYGKWHNGMQYPYHPNGRGFDDFYGFCSGHWGNYVDPMLEHNGEITTGQGYIIDDLTEHAIDFIRSNKDHPFFLYVPYNTPHGPMQVPDFWWDLVKDRQLDSLHREPDKEDLQFTKAALAMVENIDWNVGRIASTLEELQLDENTIVIYLSDNGPNSWRWNGGMKGKKGSTDEGGVKSPLLIKWVKHISPGKRIKEIASVVDLLPTLGELCQVFIDAPRALDGLSLAPLLRDRDYEWTDRYLLNHWNGRTSVRSQQFRLDHKSQLYDVVVDPGQEENIAALRPEVVAEMVTVRKQYEDQVLSELPEMDKRLFTVGHEEFAYTQLPARDAQSTGSIQRSNPSPNCTYYTNWVASEDSIYWDIDVLTSGKYKATVYYTCASGDVGSELQLSFKSETVKFEISEPHDPPLKGMRYDRYLRTQSYVKDFSPLTIGDIFLAKGAGRLVLKADVIPGLVAMDFRLLFLERI